MAQIHNAQYPNKKTLISGGNNNDSGTPLTKLAAVFKIAIANLILLKIQINTKTKAAVSAQMAYEKYLKYLIAS